MKKHWSILGSTVFATALLWGCAAKTATKPSAPSPALAAQNLASAEKPEGMAGELTVTEAVVKSIDKKNRTIMLKLPDSEKLKKVKCGPEVRNFAQIRVGDRVKTQFLETVELFVTANGGKATNQRESTTARAPLGSKPGFAALETVEVMATVQAIDYQTRNVTLKGAEGKIIKVKAGPEMQKFDEVKVGDAVVARLTKAVSITVSDPTK